MASKPKPGKCIHCLREYESLTWDHVFPESWYPESTEENLEKWKVPACIKCNSEHGRIEKDLMIRIGLCLDANDPASKGIVEKALRSINPEFGRNGKDKKARLAKRNQILGQLMKANVVPSRSIFPNFEKSVSDLTVEQEGIPIDAESIRKINEKIVKGILYLEEGIFIEPPYQVEFYPMSDESAIPFVSLIERFGTVHSREPGIVVKRATIPEDKVSSVFAIDIWSRFKMYSIVSLADI